MSESDGMDDVVDGGLRQSLMVASRIAETLARKRQEAQRQQEHLDSQAAHEAQARLAAERSAAHAALAPVEKDQWWDKAQPSDIATAYSVAEAWKDHDPTALAASERIRQEVFARYGIDTRDVGTDTAYLESGIHTVATERARLAAPGTAAGVQGQDDHKSQLQSAIEWAAEEDPRFYAEWRNRQGFTDTVEDQRSVEKELIQYWQTASAPAVGQSTEGVDQTQSKADHQTDLGRATEWAKEHDRKFYDDWKLRHDFADTVADERSDENRLIRHWQAATGAQLASQSAAVEHEKAMQLLAAARAEELRAQAAKLAPQMERHQVPVEYLANPELTKALQLAHNAKTPKALEVADAAVKERLYLIGKDGINGPDIDQLRKETTANVNGAGEEHFKDPAFVDAAKNLHEAKLLAEGGFKGDKWSTQEQRYERAEKELFARMEGVGREIENRVTGNDSSRLKDQGLKAETTSASDYGSAERQNAFAASLADSGANESQVRGRVAAERSEASHPRGALTMGKGAAKARKSPTGASKGAERFKGGPSK
ncbi:hypothetical protein [Paenarthrobacter aurescens]|uniref:Uncharacterized protein n=1 Tax=Paenarthrobacter aurescens (strain TC1) TaxID=290340 RepID=A1RDD1_PAEAT|nr:hypothetical protein [Paenarthrobacter aurescens]ABM10644.1 conserved hypothetical protein [Paenarthrobacter aurescens TC1]